MSRRVIDRLNPPPRTDHRGGPRGPRKLDDDVALAIAGYRGEGLSWRAASSLSGVSFEAVRLWLRQGEADLASGLDDTPEALFCCLCRDADALFERSAVHDIRHRKNWSGPAWLLERRDPESWGRRERREVVHTGRVEVDATVQALTDDELAAELAEAEAELARLAALGPRLLTG